MNSIHPSRKRIVDELLSRAWLRSVQWFDVIDSTNTAARRAIEQKEFLSPALFVADRQTAGRGRSDHQWWSPDGCLMLTLAISSEQLPANSADWSQLALVCGVAVADAITSVTGPVGCQLKWPNDLYLRGRKVAGILIESVRLSSASQLTGWLIGIGLNVNIDWARAPAELAQRATCLARETDQVVEPEFVLVELVEQLQRWLLGWSRGELHWMDGWRERCLLTGKLVEIRISHAQAQVPSPSTVHGRCEGVDASGRLLVRGTLGMQALSVGEVVRWQ